jgi:hypothetical protein
MVPQSPAAVYQRNGLFAAETAFQTGLDGVRTPGKSTPRAARRLSLRKYNNKNEARFLDQSRSPRNSDRLAGGRRRDIVRRFS